MWRFISAALLSLALASSVQAQDSPHEKVKSGLVNLSAVGTATKGPNAGTNVPVAAQGTGFFVTEDGYILTSAHFLDPLTKEGAQNIKYTATNPDEYADELRMRLINVDRYLDVALFKAAIPSSLSQQIDAVKTGDAFNETSAGELWTSGFSGDDYLTKRGDLIKTNDLNVPFARVMDAKTRSGQSGSPVYDRNGLIVGMIKATHSQDEDRTYFVPIELATRLISHIKMQELKNDLKTKARELDQKITQANERMAALNALINEATGQIGSIKTDRLNPLDRSMGEIAEHLEWSAHAREDGSIQVKFRKLISSEAKIEIDVKVHPKYRYIDGDLNGNSIGFAPTDITSETEGRSGRFTLLDVERRLADTGISAGLFTNPQEFLDPPIGLLEVQIIPTVGGTPQEPFNLNVSTPWQWSAIFNN